MRLGHVSALLSAGCSSKFKDMERKHAKGVGTEEYGVGNDLALGSLPDGDRMQGWTRYVSNEW